MIILSTTYNYIFVFFQNFNNGIIFSPSTGQKLRPIRPFYDKFGLSVKHLKNFFLSSSSPPFWSRVRLIRNFFLFASGRI